MPSAFSMTFGFLPSITATQELVVPRSMPMTLPMVCPLASGRSAGPLRHPDGTVANNRGALRPTPWIHVRHRPRGVLAHIGGRPWAARRKDPNSPANGALPQTLAGKKSNRKDGVDARRYFLLKCRFPGPLGLRG